MTRTIVLTLAVCTALAWAVPSDPTTPPPGLVPAATYVPDGPSDAELAPVGTSRPTSPAEVDWAAVGDPSREIPEDETTIPLTPFIDWGDDKLIAELATDPTLGKLAADVAPNGDIYVAALTRWTPGEDTIHHFRSTNGGLDWEVLTYTRADTIKDFTMRVGSDAGGVWIYTFQIQNGGLVVRRIRPDASAWGWSWIITGDTIRRVSADRNVETPQHLFVAWEDNAGRIRMQSSSDSAQTWGNHRNVASKGQNPALAAGGDGYVYVNWIHQPESTFYWVGRYTNNLISPTFVFSRIDSVATYRFRETSVAAARTTPGSSQRAIVFNTVRHANNDNHGPRYAVTTDGGVSWTASFWPVTNQARETWRARGPYIRFSYETSTIFRGIVTMPEATTSFDTLVYAYSRIASPTTWEARGVHNDYRATGEYGAQVDASSQTGGAFIVYRQWASRNIWFDGWNWTGVEENGNPVPVADPVTLPFGRNEVRLNLDRPSTVRAVLFDGAGREVAKLHDGTLDAGRHNLPVPTGRLARGVYFVNVDLTGARWTGKLVLTD